MSITAFGPGWLILPMRQRLLMLTSTKIRLLVAVLGLSAYFGGLLAVQHSDDKVHSRLRAYVHRQSEAYARRAVDIDEDLTRARERFSAESRPERLCFYTIHFTGLLLLCWGGGRWGSSEQVSELESSIIRRRHRRQGRSDETPPE